MSNLREYTIRVGCNEDWLHIAVHAESPDVALRKARRVLGTPLELWDVPPGEGIIRARIANPEGHYCTAYCAPNCPGPDIDRAIPLTPDPADTDADLRTSRQLQKLRNRHLDAETPDQRKELAARIGSTMVPLWADFSVIDALISRLAADPNTLAEQIVRMRASADLLESLSRAVCQSPGLQQPESLNRLAEAVPEAQAVVRALDLPPAGRNLVPLYDAIAQAATSWARELRYQRHT